MLNIKRAVTSGEIPEKSEHRKYEVEEMQNAQY